MPDDSYCYIAHYMDYWSKYHVLWPMRNKSGIKVATTDSDHDTADLVIYDSDVNKVCSYWYVRIP